MAPPSTMVEGEEGEKVRCSSSSEQLVMSRGRVMVRFLIIRHQQQQWLAGLLALTTNNLFHPNHPPANQHNNNQTRKLSNFQMVKLAEFQL